MTDRISRRSALASGVALLAAPAIAHAWPRSGVRLVVAFPAGGAADIVARVMAERLTAIWNQPVVVENRAGAGGNVAGAEVSRATPDGSTFLVTSQSIAVNRFLYATMPFDPMADIMPVSMAIAVPNAMVVPAISPDRSVADFIARARTNPGRLTYGSAGVGTSIHLAGELFKFMTQLDITHVPYRGAAPAMTDLIGGRLDVMFDTLTVSQTQIRAGTIRALGITSRERSPAVPEVPPIGDTVQGYEVNSWFAYFAPRGTPAEFVGKASADMAEALRHPPVAARLTELGARAIGSTPSALGEAMRAEATLWEPVIRAANIRVEG